MAAAIISQALQSTLALYNFKLVCRLTISYDNLLLKEHTPRTQRINAWNVTVWSIMVKGN